MVGKVATNIEVFVEEIGRLRTDGLRCMPKRQERDVLLAPFHTAHMCSIHAHSNSDGLLAETGLYAKSSKIVPEHLSNIHPKDGHQSRILTLRIIIRGALADPFRQPRLSGSTSQFRKHSPSTREKPREDHGISSAPPYR
jgi:hypothetical protein